MSQQDGKILEYGNITIKGDFPASWITMEKPTMGKIHKNTSKPSRKARLDDSTMNAILKEAKNMIFKHGVIYTTAAKQAEKMNQPKKQIIFKNSSRNFNHLHAVKTLVYNQR